MRETELREEGVATEHLQRENTPGGGDGGGGGRERRLLQPRAGKKLDENAAFGRPLTRVCRSWRDGKRKSSGANWSHDTHNVDHVTHGRLQRDVCKTRIAGKIE